MHNSSERPVGAPTAPVTAEYLTTREAAAYLGFSHITLEIWRCKGGGPLFSKLRNGAVRYSRAALDAFMSAHEYSNTTEAKEARRAAV
jgi:hypothetical protein